RFLKSHLFCVGDDWQNIFSFAGSNVYNILHFDEHFSYPEVSLIETNYRCPKNVVEVSNHAISLNGSQMKKQVISKSQLSYPIAIEEMPADLSPAGYEKWEFEKARDLVKLLLRNRARGEKILVLSRYNPQLGALCLEFPNYESLDLDFLTIHRAKGKEADYVLLLGCVKGSFGFPSEIREEKLLDIAKNMIGGTDEKLEEERRLFYVALTRCKKQLYLFTSRRKRSRFVTEIFPKLAPEIDS
ncbi:MAG: AAA domain-containing protein, partial [Thaumarchaeota archaeon]|nr:AAA domain-containing protein [Nitrososphaerota archaeon]